MPSWNGRSDTIIYSTNHLSAAPREDYGEYKEAGKGRTQEGQAHGAQESQDRETAETARLSARKQEAENEEVGSRYLETLRRTPRHVAPSCCRAAWRGFVWRGRFGGFVVTNFIST